MALVKMDLFEVRIDDSAEEQIVVLRECEGERILPIVIGSAEAKAILFKVQNKKLPRPLTHDLMLELVRHLGAVVERIVVTALEHGTFYARIHLRTALGGAIDVDARPSDSIALALRANAPIFVDENVLEKAA